MRVLEFTGKTVEDAVQNGLNSLGLTKTDVDIKIISEGGWLKKAKIELIINETNQENIKNQRKNDKNEQKSDEQFFIKDDENRSYRILNDQEFDENLKKDDNFNKNETKLSEKIEISVKNGEEIGNINTQNNCNSFEIDDKKEQELAVNFIKGFLKQANIDAEIEIKKDNTATILEIKTEKASMLIGKKGECMQALQTLMVAYLRSKSPQKVNKFIIDIENYRQKQNEKIEKKALNAIEKCVQTAKPVSLDYMNAFERHLVHDIVAKDGRVISESFGKEPRRFVKIYIK